MTAVHAAPGDNDAKFAAILARLAKLNAVWSSFMSSATYMQARGTGYVACLSTRTQGMLGWEAYVSPHVCVSAIRIYTWEALLWLKDVCDWIKQYCRCMSGDCTP